MSTFTLEQVKQHNKQDDIWIVLHNKVYDITKYLEEHPGGVPILIEVAGTDATEAFEDIGHSEEAKDSLAAFYIGDLPSEEHAAAVEVYRPNFEHVGHTSVIPIKKKGSKTGNRALMAVLKVGVSGALGAAILTGYNKGWSSVLQTLSLNGLFTHLFRFSSGSNGGSNGSFWTGFGIASTANLTLTLGLGMYLSTKLDVQEEFSHYSAHRRRRADRIIPRKGMKTTPAKLPVLDPKTFRLFKLTQKTLVSPDVYRFVFALPSPTDVLGLPTGQHIALRATIKGQSVSRSYTPIANNTDLGRIELLVKVYEAGLMTQHLASMEVGDEIEIRGPKGAMQYSRTYAKRIGMIAGGTGITPMYQLIRAICEDEKDQTEVSLLYANNTEEDILLREELDAFAAKNPKKFKVQYVLSRPEESWKGLTGFVSKEMIEKYLAPSTDSSKMLLCGPPPMINAMKKNLAGLGWKEPGLISKATDPVFLF